MCVNTNINIKKTIQDLSFVAWTCTVTSIGQGADHVGIKGGIYKGLVLIYQKRLKLRPGKKNYTRDG